MKAIDVGKDILPLIKKYRYLLLAAAAGIVLLLLPPIGEKQEDAQAPPTAAAEEGFSVSALEARLSEALSQVEGAGEVRVVLTVKSGARRVLAQDSTVTQRDSEHAESTTTVVVSAGSGTQEAVLLQQFYPQFQGALVVCPGGDDPAVRLSLMQSVSALTGLGSDKISICKGK